MTFDSNSDLRATFPRFTPEARKANQPVVDLLSAIAKRKKATSARIALAWLLAQKPWIVPIPGTRKLERMVENIGAAEIELTSADLREIESAFAKTTVQGARLSAGTHEADRSLIDRKAAICELVFSVPD
jgi:aryl-alcohol dehydrogenase-like predicted oxidoreductase